MSAIGPGDWVECIRVENPHLHGGAFVVGGVYCVEACGVYGRAQQGWLILEKMPRSGHPTGGWNADYFRPIYRPRADLIETLLQPVDGISPELETA